MRIKKYLSYSQYQCFNQSEEQYIKRYIDGVELKNKYVDFGKKIAKGLENRKEKTDDPDILLARKLIKASEESEKEIRITFGKIPIFGVLDGFTSPSTVNEDKTSKNKWTQAMVDKSEQLTFYAIMVSTELKISIEKVKINLDWLPTFEDTDESIHLTGEIKTFKTKRTTTDALRIYPKMKRTWLGIESLINDLIN